MILISLDLRQIHFVAFRIFKNDPGINKFFEKSINLLKYALFNYIMFKPCVNIALFEKEIMDSRVYVYYYKLRVKIPD